MPIRRFFEIFFQLAGRRIGFTFCLLLITGSVQSVGLFLIVPFLRLIGIGENESEESVPACIRRLIELAEKLGISWTLGNALILFVVAVGFIAALKYLGAISNSGLVREITREFQVRQYQNWLCRPWIESREWSGGDILNMIQQDSSQLSQFLRHSLLLCSTLVISLFYCLVALNLSPWFTLMAVLCGAVMFIGLYPMQRRLLHTSETIREGFKSQFDHITEHLNALELIKAFEKEEKETRILGESAERLQAQLYQIGRLQSMVQLIQSIVGAGLLALIVYLAVSRFSLDPASLILLIFIFSRLVPMWASIQSTWQRLVTTLPSVKAIAERFPDETEYAFPRGDDKEEVRLLEKITISNLHFTWPDANRPVFTGLSHSIPAKQITSIQGSSGSGKTTLSQILLGLIEPQKGKLLVDGSPLPRTWKQHIGFVPQESFLFSQSIRDNLLWGNPDASEDDLWDALESAAAKSFVEGLPDGLDTIVAERGDSLSGGERQRIAIARALVRNPVLLILDEPSSALDPENEEVLKRVLLKLKTERTIVLISHRAGLSNIADHQINLS